MNSKQNILKLYSESLVCLGNISKDWTVDNTKKSGLNRHFYDFSADYDAIAVDIHKYLM